MERVISLINGLPGGQKYWDSYFGIELETFHSLSKGTRFDNSAGAEPHRRALEKHGENSHQGKRAKSILDLMTQMDRSNAYDGLRHVTRRIELTEQFSLP